MTNVFIPSAQMTFETITADNSRLIDFLQKLSGSHYTLDLTGVTECDSAGLAFLIEIKKASMNQKITYKLRGLSDTIATLIHFFGLEDIIGSGEKIG